MQNTTKDAKLIQENEHGLELRHASRKSDTWPGYDKSLPLGKAGYWLGTHRDHQYIGRSQPHEDYLECFGF